MVLVKNSTSNVWNLLSGPKHDCWPAWDLSLPLTTEAHPRSPLRYIYIMTFMWPSLIEDSWTVLNAQFEASSSWLVFLDYPWFPLSACCFQGILSAPCLTSTLYANRQELFGPPRALHLCLKIETRDPPPPSMCADKQICEWLNVNKYTCI